MLRNANLVFLALALASPALAADTADRILSQGNVITVDPQNPRAEAIAIRDGKILAVGTNEEILALSGPTTAVQILDGKTVLPGFIDAHGHFSMQAQMTFMRNIASAPVGAVRSIPDLQREMRALSQELTLVKAQEREAVSKAVWAAEEGAQADTHKLKSHLEAMTARANKAEEAVGRRMASQSEVDASIQKVSLLLYVLGLLSVHAHDSGVAIQHHTGGCYL